jgi:nucleotide-binding universal stress UspA family protein
MFEKALIPLDGTELAEGILPYVTELMKGLDGSIVLLSVIDPDAVESPERLRRVPAATHARYMSASGPDSRVAAFTPSEESAEHSHTPAHETGEPHMTQIFDRLYEEAKTRLDAVVRELSTKGVAAESVVAFGHPAETIATIAEEKGCDMVAMSTHGRDPLARGVLGSVTDKITHLAHLPTLTITPERAKQYWEEGVTIDRIMVPLDGSPLAESILPYVEHLAQKLSLEIMLVRVLKLSMGSYASVGGYLYTGYPELEAEIETDTIDYLKVMAERLEAKGLRVQWKLLKGAPAVAITDLARETPHDIIALASHGRSGMRRWVLGSVADSLIRASGDPVLVIPPISEE